MRTKLTMGGLALALGLTVTALPASATSAADCPWGSVNGSVTYTPPLQATPQPPGTWSMNLTMTCVGTAPSAGNYTLAFAGGTGETCTTGIANGSITGTGPLGAITGSVGYARYGIHLYGFPPHATSTFSSGGKAFTLAIWLDVLPPSTGGPACPLAAGTVIGHAAVAEL